MRGRRVASPRAAWRRAMSTSSRRIAGAAPANGGHRLGGGGRWPRGWLLIRAELRGGGLRGRGVDDLVRRGDRAGVVAHAAEVVEVALQAGAGNAPVGIEPRHVHVL